MADKDELIARVRRIETKVTIVANQLGIDLEAKQVDAHLSIDRDGEILDLPINSPFRAVTAVVGNDPLRIRARETGVVYIISKEKGNG